MRERKGMHRILSAILCVLLAFGEVPIDAFAAENESASTQETQESLEMQTIQSSVNEEDAQSEKAEKTAEETIQEIRQETAKEFSENNAAETDIKETENSILITETYADDNIEKIDVTYETYESYETEESILQEPEVKDGETEQLMTGDTDFVIDKDGVLKEYKGQQSNVVIPDTVTAIGNRAFQYNKTIITVSIPDTVKSIGDGAFAECTNLTEVVMPNSVTEIGDYAFSECTNLTIADVPDKLVSIGGRVFSNVPITKITIPKSLENTGWEGPFNGCVTLKEVIFESGITKIASNLFGGCTGIEEIRIPNTVTEIGERAFSGCTNLTKVDLPNKLVSIGESVFADVPITKIAIPKSLERIGSYGYGPFKDCATLKEVVFEEGITKIPDKLFYGCIGIEEITIPTTVTEIGERAFSGCTNLTKVEMPNTLTKIGEKAFSGCTNLTQIDLPNRLVSIGGEAFSNVPITKITIPKSLETAGSGFISYTGAFSGCATLKEMLFEEGITRIPSGLFDGCTGIEEINIPNTVIEIGNSAFSRCTKLTEITIPDSVTNIGDTYGGYTFSGCTALKSVKLPSTITKIPSYMFKDCTSLTSIELPDTVKNIGWNAFENSGLTQITLPKNVSTIGGYAFQNCDALTSITIPNSVTSIGEYIFAECELLKDVKLGTGLTYIPSYAFNRCPSLEKIVLPYCIATIDAYAFANCTKLTEAVIPRGTTSIATNAFSYPNILTIYGSLGTYAETYAKQIGATFVNKEVKAENITLSRTELTMLNGTSYTLSMSITPLDFTDAVVWKSSDTNILTVNDAGVITANAVGTATVRVIAGEKAASCTVTVVQPVTSVFISESSLSLDAFDEHTLTASVYPDNAADKSIEWTTSDEKIASVSKSGKVMPLSKGTATITAMAKDGSGIYGSCSVTVKSEGQLCTKYSELESGHPYENNTNKIWKYIYSGAKKLDVTFDAQTNADSGFDFIYIYDGSGSEVKKATGTELAGKTVSVSGDTVKIRLLSDDAVTAWGFKVTDIDADGKAVTPDEEKPPTEESSTEESSPTESEPEDKDDSQYPNAERTSLKEVDGSIASIKTKVYDGLPYMPALKVTIKENGKNKTLIEGLDYRVIYKDNTNAGSGSVIVRGNGAYNGELTKGFTISPKSIKKLKIVTGSVLLKSQTAELPIYVYDGSKLLESGADYELPQTPSYAKNTASVTLTGKGNYNGTVTAKLPAYDVEASQIIGPENVTLAAEKEYTGKAITIRDNAPVVKIGDKTLQYNKDYKVQYLNNTNAGTAFVIVTGKGAYKGKVVKNFKITPLAKQKLESGNAIKAVTYNGKLQKPAVTVKANDKKLSNGKDYTVSYINNLHEGQATAVVTGKGNYKGTSLNIDFTILPQKISKASIKGERDNLVIAYGGKVLKEGVHFEKPSYDESSIKGKNIKVTITGIGDFKDSSVTKTVKLQ